MPSSPPTAAPRAGAPLPGGRLLALLLLVLGTFFVYWRVAGHGFTNYDDDVYVTENPPVLGGLDGESVAWAFTETHGANWHPLTWLSHMLDVQLFGLKPAGHHLVSVLLHALNAVLLFFALTRLGAAERPAFVVAALFALHPLRVESVAWVAERKDVLSGFFFMGTLLAYARWRERPTPGRYLAIAALLALGLLAKSMLVTLPCVLLLLDLWPLGRPAGGVRAVVEKLPLFALVAASAVVTLAVQDESGAVTWFRSLPFDERLANAFVAVFDYVGAALVPLHLSCFYPHPALGADGISLGDPGVLLAVAFVLAASVVAVLTVRRAPWVFVGWFWFLGMLVPVLGLFQVGMQARADRYTYLPTIGLYLAAVFSVAALVRSRPTWKPAAGALAFLALAFFGARAFAQVGVWKSSETLWRNALAVDADNALAHYNLGLYLESEGRTTEAMRELEAAVAARPDFANAQMALGLAELRGGGRDDSARRRFEAVLSIEPFRVDALASRGLALRRLGRAGEAEASYRAALERDPASYEARHGLGQVLLELERFEEAVAIMRAALELEADALASHYVLAEALARSGDHAGAKAAWQHTFRIAPPPAKVATDFAWLLVTSPHDDVRDGQRGLELARQAVEATNESRPEPLAALAAAWAELGDFGSAMRVQAQALAAAPPEAKERELARLDSYRAGRPWRE